MRGLGIVFLLPFGLVAVVATAPTVLAGPPAAAAHPEPGDVDGDGVRDEFDNCPHTRNGDQGNFDRDNFGDRCDTDADTVLNSTPYLDRGDDNCPLDPNTDQADADNNGYGNVCDVDTDRDGAQDPKDTCPDVPNPDQADYNYDRTGDICDPDDDEDGEFDTVDNCQFTYNYDQADADRDGIGTACDASEPTGDGGGGGGGGGSGDDGSGGGRDTTAPALRLALSRTQRLRELGRSLPSRSAATRAAASAGS